MTSSRPGVLAVRAVNDYRRRDVFGFLGVRFYLDNIAARSDDWAIRISTSLVMTRSQPAYFNAEHFKEHIQGGAIEHRAMFIPGPNECLAEAALLAECAKYPRVFGNPECVFSYSLSDPESRVGTFRPYTFGLRMRQSAIATACEAVPSGIVRYTDVKKFYPSIGIALARTAWERHCHESGLAQNYRNLGNELIEGYAASGLQEGAAVLTGPMFSHLLANLVLRDLDRDFSTGLPAAYCRYVDDIALIGEKADVDRSLQIVRGKVEALGLTLHEDDSPKSLVVSCDEWLPSRNDFTERKGSTSWMRLIGNLKRFLLQHPDEKNALSNALLQEGFRIPVRDYSAIVREQDFVRQILRHAPWNWFRRKAQALSVPGIVDLARKLRETFDGDFDQLFNGGTCLPCGDWQRQG